MCTGKSVHLRANTADWFVCLNVCFCMSGTCKDWSDQMLYFNKLPLSLYLWQEEDPSVSKDSSNGKMTWPTWQRRISTLYTWNENLLLFLLVLSQPYPLKLPFFSCDHKLHYKHKELQHQRVHTKQNVPKPIERKPKGRTTIYTEDCSWRTDLQVFTGTNVIYWREVEKPQKKKGRKQQQQKEERQRDRASWGKWGTACTSATLRMLQRCCRVLQQTPRVVSLLLLLLLWLTSFRSSVEGSIL